MSAPLAWPLGIDPASPEGKALMPLFMQLGVGGTLYDAATMARAAEIRERAEAAFAEAEKIHPIRGDVH